jgi:G3E family GTPase
VEQIAFADVILLNKIDLASEDDKKRIIARIKASLPTGTESY